MKIFLRILLSLGIVVAIVVVGVFGLRFYNAEHYGWGDEEVPEYHRYEAYPDAFAGGVVEHFESGMANGFHFIPDEPIAAEPIIVFGGSEGSSNFEVAENIASKGYETYALFFFGAPNQATTLNRVPLEFFGDFLIHSDLEGEPMTVIGYSKGAELGLNLTNYYEEINHLVLYTPSHYTYMGLDFSEAAGSSWTYDGEELPYISFNQADFGPTMRMMVDMLVAKPIAYRETYESAVKNSDNTEEARIDTSMFNGKALLFGAREDAMWQGDEAAEIIAAEIGDNAEAVIYEDAGHTFGGPVNLGGMALGGTEEANEEAKVHSDQQLFRFLEENVQH
ncbi:acyl-CoA thioester hydrolase/BAAT C-terminal domain-containing protein [Geomicrobium sp. JCM 19038]|uniref:acyl-CoA thioester hydrolase/BAAT C-terminal domain-containing protein n=1 Tax=Geomicrobium sp. JCM 19038 TaxID=1460635 RepID=UPI00045F499C|nr:acyl-CoA thioester hydrolase/BAAT C-terminal domain-containing protein [Geomicrobium sp. JCM 19038]GAK09471.1 acyl-CoA thioesterase 1 [Geomicrobium sp. JCM 19038]